MLYLPAGSAVELARGLRRQAAVASGHPSGAPADGNGDGWDALSIDKGFAVNPLPYGRWVEVYASAGEAAGLILLAGYETAVLTPRQAVHLADELDRADQSLPWSVARAGA